MSLPQAVWLQRFQHSLFPAFRVTAQRPVSGNETRAVSPPPPHPLSPERRGNGPEMCTLDTVRQLEESWRKRGVFSHPPDESGQSRKWCKHMKTAGIYCEQTAVGAINHTTNVQRQHGGEWMGPLLVLLKQTSSIKCNMHDTVFWSQGRRG